MESEGAVIAGVSETSDLAQRALKTWAPEAPQFGNHYDRHWASLG